MSEVVVAERLVRPHPLVAATREAARGSVPEADGRMRIGRTKGVVYLVVSKERLQRALRIVDALLKEAARRGYEVQPIDKGGYESRAGVAIHTRGHDYRVQLIELTERVPMDDRDREQWRRDHHYAVMYDKKEPPAHKSVAAGKLKLELTGRFGRSTLSDGQRGTLEERLGEVFGTLERRVAEDDLRVAEIERQRAEYLSQREEEERRARQARIEHGRAARLATDVAAWRLSCDLTEYVALLRDALERGDGDERQRLGAWLDWAEAFSERTDPIRDTRRIRGFDDDRDSYYRRP